MLPRAQLRELRAWGPLAATAGGGLAISALPDVITLVFVGRLGVTALASVSLAILYAWGMYEVISVGLALGHGALAAQAAGARHYNGVFGWTLLHLLLFYALAAALIVPVFATGGALLSALDFAGIDAGVAREYLLFSLPAFALLPALEAASAHLTAVQRMAPVFAGEVAYFAVDVLASWVLILGVDLGGGARLGGLGVRGAALANVASAAVSAAVVIAAFVRCGMPPPPGEEEEEEEEEELGDEEAAPAATAPSAADDAGGGALQPLLAADGSSTSRTSAAAAHARAVAAVSAAGVRAFAADGRNVRVFLQQSGASVASMALEIASETAISFMAASLGGTEAAVSNCAGEIYALAAMVISGAFEATSIRVGFHLGGGRPAAARRVGAVAGAAVLCWVALFCAAVLGARAALGRAFSADAAVIAGVDALAPWLCLHYAGFAAYVHACSILDGQGRAHLYPLISLLVVVIALPAAYLTLRCTRWGVPGLWAASGLGFLAGAAAAAALVTRSDWRALVLLAAQRARVPGDGAGLERGAAEADKREEGGDAADGRLAPRLSGGAVLTAEAVSLQ